MTVPKEAEPQIMKRNVRWLAAVVVVGALGLGCVAAAAAEQLQQCNVRLALTLTPDVPNPQAPGFLGAILSDPTYELTWLEGNDTQATVQLTGPGPSSQCEQALNRLSRDSHVLNVQVLPQGEGTAESPALVRGQ
jgi:hypothetical protein